MTTSIVPLDRSNSLTEGTPPALASVRREGERSEPERLTEANAGGRRESPTTRTAGFGDQEVVQRPIRRTFTADYKRRILAEVDAATDVGAVGRILRGEGLYSSHLTSWRKARDKAARAALEPNKRGPKPSVINPLQAENTQLKRESAQLQKKLRKAELIIDLQKKLSQILGVTIPALEQIDDDSEVGS